VQSLLHQPNLLWRYLTKGVSYEPLVSAFSNRSSSGASFGEEAGFLLRKSYLSDALQGPEGTIQKRSPRPAQRAGGLEKMALRAQNKPA
jgi:hypothetical protein